MTRVAGDGPPFRFRARGERSNEVVTLEGRRVLAAQRARHERAAKRHEDGLRQWVTSFPLGTKHLTRTDIAELLSILRYLEEDDAVQRVLEASGHLQTASQYDDRDPAHTDAMAQFHQCITDALRADAEAAGR